jgi:putative membrane protein
MIATRLLGAAAAGVLMLAACGQPETTAINDTTMPDTPMSTDAVAPAPDQAEITRKAQEFADKAAQANMAEIETAKLAVERATNPDVKAYAQMLIDDHTKAGESLGAAVVTAALAPPPTVLDEFHMRRVNDINEDDGDEDFDSDFINMQIDMHDDAIDLFDDYASDGANYSLKTFASNALPTLQAHKAKAEQLRDAMTSNPDPS